MAAGDQVAAIQRSSQRLRSRGAIELIRRSSLVAARTAANQTVQYAATLMQSKQPDRASDRASMLFGTNQSAAGQGYAGAP